MSSEDFEISAYFRELLEHAPGCESPDCAACGDLSRMLGAIRERLFDSVVYVNAGSPRVEPPPAVMPARRAPARRHTHSVR